MEGRVKEPKIVRTIRLSRKNNQLIKACARYNNVSQNYVINQAIEDFLKDE